MKITKDILNQKFDEYNRLYFDGELKKVKLGLLSRNFGSIVGMFEFEIDKKGHLKDMSIKINEGIDLDEEKLRRVLLHEMVHLSVTQKYRKNKKHGIAFIRECKRIENKYHVKVWHCWMRHGYINKGESITVFPFIFCRSIASIVKFRIVQKLV